MDFEYSEDQKKIIRNVREVCVEFRDVFYKANQENERYSVEDANRLREACDERGLLGMAVPKEWGGQEKSLLDYVIGAEHASRYGTGMYLGALLFYTSVGQVIQIGQYGTEEAKARYLRDLVKYRKVLGLAMAEPMAGSALTEIITTAEENGNYYILNGQKRWVGNGGEADVYYTWVREPRTRGSNGIFVLLVDKDSPGLSYGKDWGFSGVYQGLKRDLIFKNCRVPKENLLIGKDKLKTVLMGFNTFRLQNAARTLGLAEGALDVAIKWSQTRKQFGKPICEFQMIQDKLADMAMKVEAGRLLLYRAAARGKRAEADPLDTSLAKAYCNEVSIDVCDKACNILGAYGWVRESDTEWRSRHAHLLAIATGTAEIQRIRIASELLGRRFEQRLNTFNPDLYKQAPEPVL